MTRISTICLRVAVLSAASTPNKSGHRKRAIQLVNQVIDETNLGIDFGRRR